MIPYHRIARQIYNCPLLVTPDAAMTVSDYLLLRVDSKLGSAADVIERAGAQPKASRFMAGQSKLDDQGRFVYWLTPNGAAVITIIGELVNRGSWLGASSGLVSYEGIAHQVKTAAKDPTVRSIILDIESPGGEASGCFELATAIRQVAAVKPITAVINGFAYSGGYAIASACTRIVSIRSGGAGSIGVAWLHFDLSEHLKQQGVRPTLIFAGAHKVDMNPFEALSEPARAIAGDRVAKTYAMFVETVAAGRKQMTPESIRATQALCFNGDEALKLGLIDAIGTFDEVLAKPSTNGRAQIAIAAKTKPVATMSSPRVEATMENCANTECGHTRDEHPDDGACTAEGCSCSSFAAPASSSDDDTKAMTPEQLRERISMQARQIQSLQTDNHSEARRRIAAEVVAFATPLLTATDLRFNAESVTVMGNLLTVAKSAAAGIPSVRIKEGDAERVIQLNAKALGSFVSTQVSKLSKLGAKFDVPTEELAPPDAGAPQPPKSPGGTALTVADFAAAGADPAASRRIDAAVKQRRLETKNPKFGRKDLYAEVTRRKR